MIMDSKFREGFEKTSAFFPHANSKMIKLTPIDEWVAMMQKRCPDAVRTRATARDMRVFKKTPKRSK
jgi:hypothetical protein